MPDRYEAILLGVLFLLGAAVFSLWPGVDVAITRFFYVVGSGFPWGETPIAKGIYWFIWGASRLTVVVALLLWLASLAARRGWLAERRRWLGFVALALALGPGLISDQALKNHWGRARPHQTVLFGGTQQFTPALQPADQCERNCSFVSGHATAGFALMTFGWLAAPRRRARWMLAAVAVGAGVGLVRVIQGGHFTSDVFFAFYAVWLGNLLAWLILRAFGRLPGVNGIPSALV